MFLGNLPAPICRYFVSRVVASRAATIPDEIIGEPSRPYMRRWYLFRSRVCNVYLHNFLRSDDDRALHDHPWPSISLLLHGELIEWTFADPGRLAAGGYRQQAFRRGSVVYRGAKFAHRLELRTLDGYPLHTWTLFITGPKIRTWGFLCPKGWIPWWQFSRPGPGGESAEIGEGCG